MWDAEAPWDRAGAQVWGPPPRAGEGRAAAAGEVGKGHPASLPAGLRARAESPPCPNRKWGVKGARRPSAGATSRQSGARGGRWSPPPTPLVLGGRTPSGEALAA